MEEMELTKKERRELGKEEKKKERVRKDLQNKTKKIFVAVIVVGILGWFGYRIYKFVMTPSPQANPEYLQIADDDWVKGDRNAEVVLLEYGDYQCPACAGYAPVVSKLSEEYGDKLAVVYRHFPLVNIHKNAIPSAKAAEAAGLQGKYWEMHDLLYRNQEEWENKSNIKDTLIEYARGMSLDEEKFSSDFDSQEVEDRVNSDLISATSLNLNSTPSFFLNGEKVINPRGYDDLKSKIDLLIENK